ncbi:unnamed protein product [Candida verbasci]|uniref:Peroxisomal membrane protein PEX25 n=1 Tax=Candida verbasci TaxID=1227364 RepID=A0A9W4XJ13_9ASCO|nr:unnamed protein product [Candida verbasci]
MNNIESIQYTNHIPPQYYNNSKVTQPQQQQQLQPQQNSVGSNNNLLHTQPQYNLNHNQQQQHQSTSSNPSPQYRQSPLHPTSKLYAQPQQIFNSEWLEDLNSPDNSPSSSKLSKIIEEQKMSTTTAIQQQQQQQQHSKFETPSKLKQVNNFQYITPMSEKFEIEETTTITKLPKISSWKIFWSMLNDIVGKDKMAKVGQYTLRLLVYHADKSQIYLSDDKLNIKSINLKYNNSEKQLDLIKNFLKNPRDFIKIIVILICSIFKSRVAGVITGLSMYRQLLRFGKTPFRIRDLYEKFKNNINLKSNYINQANLFNRKTLGEFFSLYYGINDESILLYKFNFLTNPNYKKFVTKHESYGWYCETWLALYNAYENLQNLTQQEMDIKIQIQVKSRAKQLSKQLLGGVTIITTNNNNNGNSDDLKTLENIQFKKSNAWIDIYKNLSDLGFNTYTVFNIALPFDTWQIWMGISASVLSTIKLYRETKNKMIEQEIQKGL